MIYLFLQEYFKGTKHHLVEGSEAYPTLSHTSKPMFKPVLKLTVSWGGKMGGDEFQKERPKPFFTLREHNFVAHHNQAREELFQKLTKSMLTQIFTICTSNFLMNVISSSVNAFSSRC